MSFIYWIIGISCFTIFLILVFGLPRKKNIRIPSIEGLDSPDVAKAFEKMTNFLPFKLLRKKILSQLKKLNPNGRFIDIGCGSGNLIVQIAEKFPGLELIGIDISSEILDYAKSSAVKKGIGNKIKFKIGTVEKLPFPDNSIDFIISSLSLHHWVNPKKAINEIYRILSKNGTIFIFDFRRDSRKFFYGLLKFATKVVVPKALKNVNEPLGSLQAGYTTEEVYHLLSQLNFQNVDIKPFLAWMFIKINK